MLTEDTLVQWALMEMEREAEFQRFVTEKLAQLRAAGVDLPLDVATSLAVQAAPGIPVAKVLIEAFAAQASLPQWYRLRLQGQGKLRGVGMSG